MLIGTWLLSEKRNWLTRKMDTQVSTKTSSTKQGLMKRALVTLVLTKRMKKHLTTKILKTLSSLRRGTGKENALTRLRKTRVAKCFDKTKRPERTRI